VGSLSQFPVGDHVIFPCTRPLADPIVQDVLLRLLTPNPLSMVAEGGAAGTSDPLSYEKSRDTVLGNI
jgi:hypothetical protein